ncbi:MAG: hypothetical protein PHW60_03340 [Kiritimatiellae bacterium]|nr:hypothetical protein [Kiritimatiellia bacterium]
MPESSLPGTSKNPVQTALAWQKALLADPELTRARIARENGISRANVTQIMNLLNLPEEVISYVATLKTRQELRHFSANRLRCILAKRTVSARQSAFEKIRQEHQTIVSISTT